MSNKVTPATSMTHVIKAVTFHKVIRFGNSAEPLTDIYLNRSPDMGGNTMIEEANITVRYSDDPRFLEVHTHGKRGPCTHLIPLSNVAVITTAPVIG